MMNPYPQIARRCESASSRAYDGWRPCVAAMHKANMQQWSALASPTVFLGRAGFEGISLTQLEMTHGAVLRGSWCRQWIGQCSMRGDGRPQDCPKTGSLNDQILHSTHTIL